MNKTLTESLCPRWLSRLPCSVMSPAEAWWGGYGGGPWGGAGAAPGRLGGGYGGWGGGPWGGGWGGGPWGGGWGGGWW